MTPKETIAKASPREVRELAQYLYDYILDDFCNANTIVLEQGIIEQALEAYGGGAK